MSREHLSIMYVGDIEAGQALFLAAERIGWYVYLPAEPFEALAMAITYFPDIVVIDHTPRCTFAEEVFMHLNSLTGEPPVMLVLTNVNRWDKATTPNVHLLPYTATREQVLQTIESIVRTGVPMPQ